MTEILSYFVSGEKAAAFLHGQFTNDIKGLSPGQGNYNLLLTQKGKVRADLFIYRDEGGFYLLIPKPFSEIVISHLQKLATLSRVKIAETQNFAFLQPQIADLPFNLDKTTRVENGVPLVGHDVTEENFPQEGRLDHALHFNKGCYLGQEIIARLHYRGHVNKILSRFVVESEESVPEGEPIFFEDKAVGKITSSVFSPKFQNNVVLGYVPYNQKDESRFFQMGNHKKRGRIL